MSNFAGLMSGGDTLNIVQEAKKVYPGIKRLYIDADDNKIKFTARIPIHDGTSVINRIITEYDREMLLEDLPVNLLPEDTPKSYHGYAYCMSIPEFDRTLEYLGGKLGPTFFGCSSSLFKHISIACKME